MVDNLTKESVEQAKKLAPWRTDPPWWVILVEGIVVGVVGILNLIDPHKTTINVALFLAAALVVAGVIQLWSVMRGKAPETADALIAARGAIGVYSGAVVLLLYFLQHLKTEAGLIVFGLGSLIYGILGLWSSITSKTLRRRTPIVESIFFTLFGILQIYVLIASGKQVQQAATIVGWTAIVGGLALIGLSFYNRSRDANREQLEEQALAAGTTASAAANAGPMRSKTHSRSRTRPAVHRQRERVVRTASVPLALAEPAAETESQPGRVTAMPPDPLNVAPSAFGP